MKTGLAITKSAKSTMLEETGKSIGKVNTNEPKPETKRSFYHAEPGKKVLQKIGAYKEQNARAYGHIFVKPTM